MRATHKYYHTFGSEPKKSESTSIIESTGHKPMMDRVQWREIIPEEGKFVMAAKWHKRRLLARTFCFVALNKDDLL